MRPVCKVALAAPFRLAQAATSPSTACTRMCLAMAKVSVPEPAKSSSTRALAVGFGGRPAITAPTIAASPSRLACRKPPAGGMTGVPASDVVAGRSRAAVSGSAVLCAQLTRGTPLSLAKAARMVRSETASFLSVRSRISGPESSRFTIADPSCPNACKRRSTSRSLGSRAARVGCSTVHSTRSITVLSRAVCRPSTIPAGVRRMARSIRRRECGGVITMGDSGVVNPARRKAESSRLVFQAA